MAEATAKKAVVVLRYGHRLKRDARVSTHCCLVARALGAEKIILAGEKDLALKKEIDGIVKRWGGRFKVELQAGWKKALKAAKKRGFKVVNLSMYGLPVQDVIEEIRREKKVLVFVGGQKVPGEVYRLSDFNVSVSQQPHSEIAALAVFLHEYFQGRELEKKFGGAKISLVPQAHGKKVLKK